MTARESVGASGVEIREATVVDAVAIAAIHVRSWLATYHHEPDLAHRVEVWRERLASSTKGPATFVAVDGETVTGFIHVGPSPDPDHDPSTTGQILSVHVDPEHTGRGIGSVLLRRAINAFVANGQDLATLWVVTDNQKARVFYERLGWRPDSSTRREPLAVEGEPGDEVEVARYQYPLGSRQVEGE